LTSFRQHATFSSVQHLLNIIYRYYPRGLRQDDPRWEDSPEHLALKEATRTAAAERRRFLDMLSRLRTALPGCDVIDHSLHLPAGRASACYPGLVLLPKAGGIDRRVGFQISFLVPHYVLYSERYCQDTETVRLQPHTDDRPYWDTVAREIESTYGASPMPSELGHVTVPDVEPGHRRMGEAMIYDCFFDDSPRLIESG
jgi:hypothetical protein